MTGPVIADHLSKWYGQVIGLNDVSVTVPPGITGLLGPNGAGKSTLIRMLVTLLQPTAGTALVNGFDVVKQADGVRQSIGVIPQAMTSDLELSVEENLIIFAKLYSVPRARRERLIAEPELMPTAIEELLRAYAPVTMAREVMKDTVISGCPVKSGNMVLLSFPAANRDPAMFPDADKVVIDRKENRHAAFGLGIHRCVGSNLARMEMTVAIEEWLKRIPDFRLDPAGQVSWSEGTVRGPRQLPMLFGKAG